MECPNCKHEMEDATELFEQAPDPQEQVSICWCPNCGTLASYYDKKKFITPKILIMTDEEKEEADELQKRFEKAEFETSIDPQSAY